MISLPSVAFERAGDHLESVSAHPCGFMRLRGAFAGPETVIPLGDRTVKRMGYGAIQLAGPGVFGAPGDRDAALAVGHVETIAQKGRVRPFRPALHEATTVSAPARSWPWSRDR